MTNPESQAAGAHLLQAMWWYAGAVLYPTQTLKNLGIPVSNQVLGDKIKKTNTSGLGPKFSRTHKKPILLNKKTSHDHLVEDFDDMSEMYADLVKPFSQPIFEEAIKIMKGLISRDSRILDAGCGPGRELFQMTDFVPRGEVVGIDLSAGMVKTAHKAAKTQGVTNCSFFQSDVGDLPHIFTEQFDLVYNCLAHHHYPEPLTAAKAIHRCLRDGGVYCVVDPGPEWYNKISAPIAKWADPGWIGFHTPQEFMRLFKKAGFERTAWMELLPGFGVAIGQKFSSKQKK